MKPHIFLRPRFHALIIVSGEVTELPTILTLPDLPNYSLPYAVVPMYKIIQSVI